MAAFYCTLIAPRPTFALDMTPEEGALMQAHAGYWHEAMARGHVVAFGMVADPAGAFGVGLVEFPDLAAVRAFTDADPTIRSGRGFRFDVHAMPMGIARP
jgi:uncharacterized protein YciI